MDFEKRCHSLKHSKCSVCHRVSLLLQVNRSGVCNFCVRKKAHKVDSPFNLPIWRDLQGVVQYTLPKELIGLRIGEQMMIQRLSLYVPIQYLRFGQLCCSGHVCAFPQDIQEVCSILPRLPKQVTRVRVIKKFCLNNTAETATKSFIIRKDRVLNALRWLKLYNLEYSDILIDEHNLDWMGGANESELPIEGDSIDKNLLFQDDLSGDNSNDQCPSPSTVCLNKDIDDGEAYGVIDNNFTNSNACTDHNTNHILQSALATGNTKNTVRTHITCPLYLTISHYFLGY